MVVKYNYGYGNIVSYCSCKFVKTHAKASVTCDKNASLACFGTILSESYENDGTHLVAMLEADKLYQLQKALGIPFEKPKADWENDDD